MQVLALLKRRLVILHFADRKPLVILKHISSILRLWWLRLSKLRILSKVWGDTSQALKGCASGMARFRTLLQIRRSKEWTQRT